MTTFQLTEAEQRHIEAFDLFVASMADWFALEDVKDGGAPPDVPRWVKKVYARLDSTLYAPVNAVLGSDEITPYRLGYALGLIVWGSDHMALKLPPEVRAIRKGLRLSKPGRKIVRERWTAFLLRAGLLERKGSRYILGFAQPMRRFEKMAEEYSVKESAEYHQGYADGLRGVGQGAPGDRSTLATDIYFALMIWWRFVPRLGSVPALHKWLSRILTPAKVGELKRVEKLTQRLGLRFRARGRPKKIQTSASPA